MADCALCGDPELSHNETRAGSRFLGRCRVRTQMIPPTKLVPEGHYERCDCPGYEPGIDRPDDEDDYGRVLCRCANEYVSAEQARRSGCDQTGGCPELQEAFDFGLNGALDA